MIAAALLLLITACRSTKDTTAPYFNYETECRGTSMDGVVQLTAWGKGTTRREAIEQAKKQALNDVLFSGVLKGNNHSVATPLVADPHAKRKHEDYFLDFFAGDYASYTKIHKPLYRGVKRYKNGADLLYRVYIDVERAALKRQLIKDGIINKETR